MDIFATVCDALAVRPLPDLDGVSFWPTLLGQTVPEPKRDLYFVRREGRVAYGGKTIEAYRRGDWKLLQDSPFAPFELYDLKSDPLETTNLAAKEQRVFNQLAAGLRKQIQRGGQVPLAAPADDPMKESAGAPAPEPVPAAAQRLPKFLSQPAASQPIWLLPPTLGRSLARTERPSGRRLAEKPLRNRALQPNLVGVETALMKRNASSESAGRLDNTPKWDVIQVCLITC